MRTARARREELLVENERSGLSQAAFARRAGVRYPTFAHWLQKWRSTGGDNAAAVLGAAASPRFVELRLPAAPPPRPLTPATELSVTLPDGVMLRGAEPSALAALARALREA